MFPTKHPVLPKLPMLELPVLEFAVVAMVLELPVMVTMPTITLVTPVRRITVP